MLNNPKTDKEHQKQRGRLEMWQNGRVRIHHVQGPRFNPRGGKLAIINARIGQYLKQYYLKIILYSLRISYNSF